MRSKDYLHTLDDEKLAIAKHGLSHLAVHAGAGTGKTSLLIARVLHLLTNKLLSKPIIVLTFSKRPRKSLKSVSTN
ncbi:MAG: UvrD-helicase domain-containing protein [Psychrosphaera sp.]|nr:UvrD-helicase domain-containing protein [Psychrosphaera sp.]